MCSLEIVLVAYMASPVSNMTWRGQINYRGKLVSGQTNGFHFFLHYYHRHLVTYYPKPHYSFSTNEFGTNELSMIMRHGSVLARTISVSSTDWFTTLSLLSVLFQLCYYWEEHYAAFAAVCARPEIRFLNFEFEIDFISNQYETIQTKQHKVEQLMHDTVSQWNDCSRVMAVGVVLMSVSITSSIGRTMSTW